jgi:hypothetical protein
MPGDADVRRKLAADLIAEANAGFDLAEARADASFGVGLAVDAGFDERLHAE